MADSEKYVKPTPEDLVTKLFIGEPLDLGQKCPECPERHLCDAICMRFSPRVFKCLGCGQYHKHRETETLLREFQMNKLLGEREALDKPPQSAA